MDIASSVKKELLGMDNNAFHFAESMNSGVEILVFVILKLSESNQHVSYVDLTRPLIRLKKNVFVVPVLFGALGKQTV